MGRLSTKENKTPYQVAREKLDTFTFADEIYGPRFEPFIDAIKKLGLTPYIVFLKNARAFVIPFQKLRPHTVSS